MAQIAALKEACELFLELVLKNRDGVGVQAKEVMVGLLQVMGSKSRLAADFFKRLASAFY